MRAPLSVRNIKLLQAKDLYSAPRQMKARRCPHGTYSDDDHVEWLSHNSSRRIPSIFLLRHADDARIRCALRRKVVSLIAEDAFARPQVRT